MQLSTFIFPLFYFHLAGLRQTVAATVTSSQCPVSQLSVTLWTSDTKTLQRSNYTTAANAQRDSDSCKPGGLAPENQPEAEEEENTVWY